jgi:hypothetical protein
VSVNDRLFDELLRPIVDDYYEAATALAGSENSTTGPRSALVARMKALQECGNRTALVLEVADPLWDDIRDLAGLLW